MNKIIFILPIAIMFSFQYSFNWDPIQNKSKAGDFGQADMLQDSLLVFYSFSGNAADSIGNAFHGEIFGPTLTNDRFGQADRAYYFDGEDDYITIPQDTMLEPDFPFAISIWVKQDTGSLLYDRGILTTDFHENTTYYGAFIQLSNEKVEAFYGDGCCGYAPDARKSVEFNGNNLEGDWHHIFVNYFHEDSIRLYVDLTLANTEIKGNATEGVAYTAHPGSIGRFDNTGGEEVSYFKGVIDDFRFFNTTINENEIEELYYEGCVDQLVLQNMIITSDTAFATTDLIQMEDVSVPLPYSLTLESSNIIIEGPSEIQLGAGLKVINNKGCLFIN